MTKKFLKLIIISLFFVFLLIGCEKATNTEKYNNTFQNTIQNTSDRDVLPIAKQGGGINLGLYDIRGNIENNMNFFLNENEQFEKFISIGNFIDKSRTYKLLAFVDFVQTPFSVDGRKEELDFTFNMESYETMEIPVKLQPMDKGQHEILFVIVKDPNNDSIDEEFRKNTDMNHLLFIRCNVTVEENLIPKYDYTVLGDIKEQENLDGVFINEEKDNFKRWLYSTVNIGGTLPYYLHVGNNRFDDGHEYALIMLQDWKQIKIQDDDVIYFKLNKNELITVNAMTNKILKEGVYDLTPILIHNPYATLDYGNKEVETGIRVGIEVIK